MESTHRKYLMTAQSFGTGANNTLSRMLVVWVKWLSILKEQGNKTAANIFSQTIRFVFSNTHQPSLDAAKLTVDNCLKEYPGIKLAIEFELMEDHIDNNDPKLAKLRGKGSPSIEIGELAIEKYLPKVLDYVADTHFYLPIATLGLGHTGSAAIVPVTEAANSDLGCWVMPLVLLSSTSELNSTKLNYQLQQKKALQQKPVFMMLADNAYFTRPEVSMNQRLSMQESYNRIDYLAITALRSLLMMFAHPTQIDESKLENSIFAGPGGLLCIGGIDINLDFGSDENFDKKKLSTEANRAARLLFENPFVMEWYEGEENLGYDLNAKFDVAVLGTMGDFSAPKEHEIMSVVKQHKYLQMFLPTADLHFHRFGSDLPEQSASLFSLFSRKRVGEPIPLRYPPHDHPVMVALRNRELGIESALTVEKIGREGIDDRNDAIPEPHIPLVMDLEKVEPEQLVPAQSVYQSCREFIEKDPDLLTEILQRDVTPSLTVISFTDGFHLMDFINERTVARNFALSPSSRVWLAEKLKSFTDVRLPTKSKVSGMDYDCQKQSLTVLANYLTQVGGLEGNLEEIQDPGRQTLKKVYLARKVLGDNLAKPLFA